MVEEKYHEKGGMSVFRKAWLPGLILSLLVGVMGPAWADKAPAATVQLTPQQQEEMAGTYEKLWDSHRELIQQYARLGVFTPEQAKKANQRLERWQEKVKENNYLPLKKGRGRCPHDKDKTT